MEYNKQFESNSHKHNEEKAEREAKRLDPVVSKDEIKMRKKNPIKRFMDIFSMTDSAEVKAYVVNDVLIPLVKNGLYELISSALQMKFFGQVKPAGTTSASNALGSRIKYDGYFISSAQDRPKPKTEHSRSVYAYENIGFTDQKKAVMILDQMLEWGRTYGVVPVSKFYELVGETINDVDWTFGWTDLRKAQVIGDQISGYFLSLPKAKPLDR